MSKPKMVWNERSLCGSCEYDEAVPVRDGRPMRKGSRVSWQCEHPECGHLYTETYNGGRPTAYCSDECRDDFKVNGAFIEDEATGEKIGKVRTLPRFDMARTGSFERALSQEGDRSYGPRPAKAETFSFGVAWKAMMRSLHEVADDYDERVRWLVQSTRGKGPAIGPLLPDDPYAWPEPPEPGTMNFVTHVIPAEKVPYNSREHITHCHKAVADGKCGREVLHAGQCRAEKGSQQRNFRSDLIDALLGKRRTATGSGDGSAAIDHSGYAQDTAARLTEQDEASAGSLDSGVVGLDSTETFRTTSPAPTQYATLDPGDPVMLNLESADRLKKADGEPDAVVEPLSPVGSQSYGPIPRSPLKSAEAPPPSTWMQRTWTKFRLRFRLNGDERIAVAEAKRDRLMAAALDALTQPFVDDANRIQVAALMEAKRLEIEAADGRERVSSPSTSESPSKGHTGDTDE